MAKTIKRGKWYYSDLTIKGKRIRERLSIYPDVADKMLDDMQEMAYAQRHGTIPQDMSWEFFKDRYRTHTVDAARGTRYVIERMLRIVETELQPRLLRHLTPERLADLNARMKSSEHYTPSIVARIIKQVKAAMHFAEDMKYVQMGNWRIIKVVEPVGRLDFYEFDAFHELLEKLKAGPVRYYTAAYLMGRAGLRRGEFYYLEWPDIQFPARQISFRSKPHFGWKIKSDRKGNKLRQIPLSLDYGLEQHLQSLARPQGLVLDEDRSANMQEWGIRFANVLKATGVKTHLGKYGTAHLLRHTFGSHLAQAGVSLSQIRDWMGHATTRMTEVYSHLMPGNQSGFTFKIPVSTLCQVERPVKPTTALLSPLNGDRENGNSH